MEIRIEMPEGTKEVELRRSAYGTWIVTTLPKVERLFESTNKAEAQAVTKFLANRMPQ